MATREYGHLMSFWRHPQTGACHASLKGTIWPGYQLISEDEYDRWQAQQKARTSAPPPGAQSEDA